MSDTTPKPNEWHRRPKGFAGLCPICAYPHDHGEHRAVAPDENMAAKWLWRTKSPTGWKIHSVLDSETPRSPVADRATSRTKAKCAKLDSIAKQRQEQLQTLKSKLREQTAKAADAWRRERKAALRASAGAVPTRKKPGPRPGTIIRPHIPTPRVAKLMAEAVSLITHGKTVEEVANVLGVKGHHVHDWRERWKDTWKMLVDRTAESLVVSVRTLAGSDQILKDAKAYMGMADFIDGWTRSKGIELFPRPEGEMTLSRFYVTWYEPQLLFDGMESTKTTYASTLKAWRLITGDPPIKAITADTLALFRDVRLKSRGQKAHLPMSPNTVRGDLRRIGTLLDKLGPPGRGNRDALGILERVPWVKPPREEEKIPQTVSLQHLSDCYLAAVAMEFPRLPGVKAPAWWQALLVVAWNTGLRRGTLFKLRWDDIDWNGKRLVLPAARMKSKRPMRVHLTDVAIEALRSIQGVKREYVFRWSESKPSGKSTFDTLFHRLQTAAAIPRDQHFGLHTIRKTVATTLWEVSPGAAQAALGHTTSDVTRKHYVDGGPLVARALDKLPQPEGFTKKPSHGTDAAA